MSTPPQDRINRCRAKTDHHLANMRATEKLPEADEKAKSTKIFIQSDYEGVIVGNSDSLIQKPNPRIIHELDKLRNLGYEVTVGINSVAKLNKEAMDELRKHCKGDIFASYQNYIAKVSDVHDIERGDFVARADNDINRGGDYNKSKIMENLLKYYKDNKTKFYCVIFVDNDKRHIDDVDKARDKLEREFKTKILTCGFPAYIDALGATQNTRYNMNYLSGDRYPFYADITRNADKNGELTEDGRKKLLPLKTQELDATGHGDIKIQNEGELKLIAQNIHYQICEIKESEIGEVHGAVVEANEKQKCFDNNTNNQANLFSDALAHTSSNSFPELLNRENLEIQQQSNLSTQNKPFPELYNREDREIYNREDREIQQQISINRGGK